MAYSGFTLDDCKHRLGLSLDLTNLFPDAEQVEPATSGREWQFLKLEGSTLLIDHSTYNLNELAKLFGALTAMVRSVLPRRSRPRDPSQD